MSIAKTKSRFVHVTPGWEICLWVSLLQGLCTPKDVINLFSDNHLFGCQLLLQTRIKSSSNSSTSWKSNGKQIRCSG